MRSLVVVLALASVAHADGNGNDEVLAPLAEHGKPPVPVPPPAGAKKQAIVTTVVAGGLVASAGFSYLWSQHVLGRLDNIPLRSVDVEPRHAVIEEADKWHNASYWLAAGSLISLGIAGYMWTRTERRFVPQVAASSDGGAVGLAGSF